MTEMSLSDVVPGAPQGQRRRSQRAAEKRRKRRRRRTWVTVLVMVVVLGGAGTGAWFGLKPLLASFNASDDFKGPGHGSVTVQIPPGASGSDIAGILAKAGVVKTPKAYLAAAADTPGTGREPPTWSGSPRSWPRKTPSRSSSGCRGPCAGTRDLRRPRRASTLRQSRGW